MTPRLLVSVCLLTLSVSGCVPGDGTYGADSTAGFLWGVWHGWIAPISLIWGFLDPEIRIYEAYNAGWWYDFGFYMAIISGFGGLSFFRRNKN
jgi:hypothetical protein